MGNWKVLVPDELYYDSFLGPLGYWYYINLCENPSAELGTTGWTTGGTNTLTSDSLADFIGVKGFKATYSNSPTLGSYAITLPLLASTYYVSAFVYVSSINYTGGIISIDATNFSGATVTPVETADVQLYTSAYWQRIVSRIDLDADTSGEIIIKATNPTSGFVYFDAVMIVKSDYDVSYIDGDQDDCEWIGFPHESKSRRPFISRAGGQILDVESDLGFYVEQLDGIGMPPVRNLAQYRGHLDGREFSRTIANERLFRLT